MELEEPLMQGILLLPPQGMLGQLKKTWHKRFCQLYKASKYGIERVEIYDNHKEALLQIHSPRIITLEACIKIAPSNQPHVFTVLTKSGCYHFGCSTESDMSNWIEAFQSVAFKDNASTQTIEEDNDLYCTSGEGIFSVKLVETEASRRCGLEAKNYTLVVAAADIKLMSGDVMLYTWPYRYIKRYGHREGKFTFEAGRKCESGEGSFHLQHSNRQEIFRCVSSKMESMKRLLNGESSPNIECNDAQYHAALSMEAGSRSPLPPSPNSSGNLIDIDFCTISQNSQKHLNSSSSSLESITHVNKPPPPIVKPKPAKPPRKYIFPSLLERKPPPPHDSCAESSEQSSSSLSNNNNTIRKLIQRNSPTSAVSHEDEEEKNPYDLVEVRNNVVKTYGNGNLNETMEHRIIEKTEKFSRTKSHENIEDIQYETMMMPVASSENNSSKSLVINTVSPIIHNAPSKMSDSQDYDKLQHFGSTHRLNNHNPGYRTPNISISSIHSSSSTQNPYSTVIHHNNNTSTTESNFPTPTKSNTTWYSYEIVEDMCAVRLADDSHHGYGMIRKKSNVSTSSTPPAVGPKHTIYNNTEYAIVSKPKRV